MKEWIIPEIQDLSINETAKGINNGNHNSGNKNGWDVPMNPHCNGGSLDGLS